MPEPDEFLTKGLYADGIYAGNAVSEFIRSNKIDVEFTIPLVDGLSETYLGSNMVYAIHNVNKPSLPTAPKRHKPKLAIQG